MKTPKGREVRFTKLSSYPHRWRAMCDGKKLFLEKHTNGRTILENEEGPTKRYPNYEKARDAALKWFDKNL